MKFKNRQEYEKSKLYFNLENCPFCTKLDKKEIIFESELWIVLHNNYPYFKDQNNLIAIPKRHIEFTSGLKEEEFADFVNIEKWMKNYYKDKWEYFSFIRQSKSNKSVEHIHYHYLVGLPWWKIIDWENYLKIKNWYFSE